MLSEALAFPRADDDWLKTVLIGGVLSIFSFLIIPGIVINGYLLRVTRAAVESDETPPRFEDWVDLFVDGLLVWIVQFVFVGLPVLLLALVGAFGYGFAVVGPDVAGLLVLVAVVVLLVIAYVLPAAIANFALTGEFTAAFDLRTVTRAAASMDYLVAILLVIAVSIVLGFIGGLLTIILVGVFVLFYLQMVIYHLFGQGFARGVGLESSAEPTAG